MRCKDPDHKVLQKRAFNHFYQKRFYSKALPKLILNLINVVLTSHFQAQQLIPPQNFSQSTNSH